MKNKIFILLLLMGNLYANDIETFNNKAVDMLSIEPSVSIYYIDNSLDLNQGFDNKFELVRSMDLKARAYANLNEYKTALNYANTGSSYNSKWDYPYKNGSYYIFYIGLLFETGNYEKAQDVFSNSSIIDFLSQRELIEFKLLQIKLDILLEREVSIDVFTPLVNGSKGLEYYDLLAKIYILHGDVIFSEPQNAIRKYNSAIGLGQKKEEAIALKKIALVYREMGSNLTSLDFLKNAYLTAQSLEDNNLILEIIDELEKGYLIVSDYKGLSDILSQKNIYKEIMHNFLLREQKKLNNRDYSISTLSNELQGREFLVEILSIAVIVLSFILIFTIVIISIQSYKIKKINVGEH